jgi:hypothetical protein
MDFSAMFGSLQTTLGTQLPRVLGAIGILIVGWLVAVIVRAGVNRLLAVLRVNARIEESTGQKVGVERAIAIGAFWLVILITLVAVFDSLHLALLSDSFGQLVGKVIGYLPSLVAGTVIALVAWLLATLVRAAANKILAATTLDDRLAKEAGMEPMSKTVANVLFWLVILFSVPGILSAYQLHGLLEPVQQMLAKILAVLPNVIAAAIIAFVGWLLAKVLRGLVTNILTSIGTDKLGTSAGFASTVKLSRIAGTIVFILVFVPSLIAALDALQIPAISGPATDMLDRFLVAVPNIVAAALILVLTWYVAKFASALLGRLLASIGIDNLPQKLGVEATFTDALPPSAFVAGIALFFAMLFAVVEAANRLDFGQVRDVVTMFIKFGGDVILGAVILVVGLWLANLVYRGVYKASGEGATGLAQIARFAVIGLVIAMGLRAMGIANDIVNLAFGLTLGAIAVAFALSFGLGGRDAAGRQMEHWLSKLRRE